MITLPMLIAEDALHQNYQSYAVSRCHLIDALSGAAVNTT